MNKRQLGDPAPDRMYIFEGEVCMQDGSELSSYLTDWQESFGIADGTPICIVTSEELEKMEEKLISLLAFTFC